MSFVRNSSLIVLLFCLSLIKCSPPLRTGFGWYTVPDILEAIVLPTFPDRDYVVTEYGAVGDSIRGNREAFQTAINTCNAQGGGRIIVPGGHFFLDGPIHLKSNVHLFLDDHAIIRFSDNPDDYLPLVLTRWEGVEVYNYSPFIYAYQATNVAITGKGTINGNAATTFAAWRPLQKVAQQKLRAMGTMGVPVHERLFGPEHWLRPSMIQTYGCKNVLIDGPTILDSPFWVIHPTLCTNVTVRNVHVKSWNPNNDGCNPDGCVNVLIENCVFETGDDAVAIKSGRDQDGWRIGQATENVVVRNCIMRSKANGLCIGSEMSAGVRNIYIHDCSVHEAGSTIYFKSNFDRGGIIENVHVRNITVERALSACIRFESNYKNEGTQSYPPTFRNIVIEDVLCKKADAYGIYAVSAPGSHLEHIFLKNITIHKAQHASYIHPPIDVKFDRVRINGVHQESKGNTLLDSLRMPVEW